MIIYIDIDQTVCYSPDAPNYETSEPIIENIEKANQLFNEGHTVIYWTARGATTGIDWRQLTEKQFKKWGIKYNELKFGKPHYDVFIDDKNINTLDWDNEKIKNFKGISS